MLLLFVSLAHAAPADLPDCEGGPDCLADGIALHDAYPVACLDGDADACVAWSRRAKRIWVANAEGAADAALDACELGHKEACARAPGPATGSAPAAPTLVLRVTAEGYRLESFAGGTAPHDELALPCTGACDGPESYDVTGLQGHLRTYRAEVTPLMQRCIVLPDPELSMDVVAQAVRAVRSTGDGVLLFPDVVLAGDVQ